MVGLVGLEPMTSTMSKKRCLLLNHHHIDYKIIIIFASPEWKFKAVSVLRQVADQKEIAHEYLEILMRFAIIKIVQLLSILHKII